MLRRHLAALFSVARDHLNGVEVLLQPLDHSLQDRMTIVWFHQITFVLLCRFRFFGLCQYALSPVCLIFPKYSSVGIE